MLKIRNRPAARALKPNQPASRPARLLAVVAGTWLGLLMVLGTSSLVAQDDFGAPELFPDFSLGQFDAVPGDPYEWSANYTVTEAGSAQLNVQVSVDATWHVYSVTQEPGGPTKTKLSIVGPSSVKATAAFTPSEPPHKSRSTVFKGVTVEEHEGVVVWSAPITVPDGFKEPIRVAIDALVCKTDGSCIPVTEELTATFAGTASSVAMTATPKVDPPAEGKPFRDGDYVVQWTGSPSPKRLKPGAQGVLKFTAKPGATYHVYRAVVNDSDSSTNFVVTKKAGLKIGAPRTSNPVISKELLPGTTIHYHSGAVTWSLPIEVPSDIATGDQVLEGMIGYQACTDDSCQKPMALKFTAQVKIDPQTRETSIGAFEFVSAKSATALDTAAELKWVDKIEAAALPAVAAPEEPKKSFAGILFFAFIGGVILNFMPCVLPVVGLKVMSFVKQAGEDRGRVLKLNVVYVLGILSVFALLAVLAVALNFTWGEQFTYFEVKLGLALLLFALALSYLGVWEIPAPSFASSKKSQELESREGYTGAFAKGAFATVLATPCSGPLLGFILGSTLGFSSLQTVVVIMTVGIGMSLPYLIIGARPELVSWLPKPGAWMETLKEFLAFLFLGTVAFFFKGFSDEHKMPVFVALIGVWFGCWVIGKVPNWETFRKRMAAWAIGVGAAAAIGIGAFQYLVPGEAILPWESYSEDRLAELQGEGKTVMVDFTADWCVNCLVNYEIALDTEETKVLLDELEAVPMIADWSDRSNTIIPAKLQELRSRSIPVLAIYPGSRPDQPIILRDLVSQGAVLEALRKAGPSLQSSAATASEKSATIAAAH